VNEFLPPLRCALAQASPLLDLLGPQQRAAIATALGDAFCASATTDLSTPERHLPTPGQCGHSPQQRTAAGTAVPTTTDEGETVPQRVNPSLEWHTTAGTAAPTMDSGPPPVLSPVYGCQVALRFPLPPFGNGVADGEAALPGLFARTPLEWCVNIHI